MLVLTRKSTQSVMIGDDVEVTVLAVMGDKVRLGINAPRAIPVFRTEVYAEIHTPPDATLPAAVVVAEVDQALGSLGT